MIILMFAAFLCKWIIKIKPIVAIRIRVSGL